MNSLKQFTLQGWAQFLLSGSGELVPLVWDVGKMSQNSLGCCSLVGWRRETLPCRFKFNTLIGGESCGAACSPCGPSRSSSRGALHLLPQALKSQVSLTREKTNEKTGPAARQLTAAWRSAENKQNGASKKASILSSRLATSLKWLHFN